MSSIRLSARRSWRPIVAGLSLFVAMGCRDSLAPFDGADEVVLVAVGLEVSAVVDTAAGTVVVLVSNTGTTALTYGVGGCIASLVIIVARDNSRVFDSEGQSCTNDLQQLTVEPGETREWPRGVAAAHHLGSIVTDRHRAYVLLSFSSRETTWIRAAFR